jgi:hypothetical protein
MIGPHDCAPCVAAAPVDALDLSGSRPVQGRLQGRGGT